MSTVGEELKLREMAEAIILHYDTDIKEDLAEYQVLERFAEYLLNVPLEKVFDSCISLIPQYSNILKSINSISAVGEVDSICMV